MAATTLKFFELIDLAVDVPTVNSINLNLLQAVLQLIATHIGLNQVKIEFEGDDAKKVKDLQVEPQRNPNTLINYFVANEDPAKLSAMAKKTAIQADARTPVKRVEFNRLESKVRMLASHVEAITMLPATDEIIEKMRSNPDTKPVTELVHSVALTKRISAVEETISKFASILESIYKDQNRIRTAFTSQYPDVNIDASEVDVSALTTGVIEPVAEQSESPEEFQNLVSNHEILRQGLENLTKKVDDLAVAIAEAKYEPAEDVKHSVGTNDYSGQESGTTGPMDKKFFFIEKVIQTNETKLKNVEQHTKNELLTLHEQQKAMEVQVNAWIEKLNECFGDQTMAKSYSRLSAQLDHSAVTEMTAAVSTIQQVVDEMATSMQTLIVDVERKNEIIRKLRLAIDKIETTKLDKEFLDASLAGKADLILVNRKVSYDQFDVTCNELNNTVTDTIRRVSDQESQWSNVIEELHCAIKNKLDKVEVSPIKEFINHRLKLLQDKLKFLIAEKLELEAAGTKKKLMRNLQCISCDKQVLQKVDKEQVRTNEFPLRKNIKPYLTYELDQIRRQERCLPASRNINDFAMVLTEAANQKKAKGKKGKVDQLCTRYCGGSHTRTTATQRISRTGHYSELWDVKALPYADITHPKRSNEKLNILDAQLPILPSEQSQQEKERVK